MAKFITKFDTTAELAAFSATTNFGKPHVSLTKDDMIVHYHPISSLAVGTYLYNNGTTGTTANSNVVGVCVIPDGLLPDRKARFMSVLAITEDSEESIVWSNDYSRTVLPKQYTQVPCVGLNKYEEPGAIANQVEHSSDSGYMPSDSENGNFTALTNQYDSVTKFACEYYDHHIPSPFMDNGAFNENYSTLFTTGGTAINNALSDFDGFRNTQILIKDADVVAAKQCAMFKPGYRDGEWYLPAVGELGFIMPRFKVINSKLSALGPSGVQLYDGYDYWSSTESDGFNAWGVNTGNGYVCGSTKGVGLYVRAFLAL